MANAVNNTNPLPATTARAGIFAGSVTRSQVLARARLCYTDSVARNANSRLNKIFAKSVAPSYVWQLRRAIEWAKNRAETDRNTAQWLAERDAWAAEVGAEEAARTSLALSYEMADFHTPANRAAANCI